MGRCCPEDSFSHLSSFTRVPFQATELKSQSQAPPPLKKMGDLSFKCIKISQNFSSHALKFDSSSSQDPLLRGNFQFASCTLWKCRLDSEHPYLTTCWVPPPTHTKKNICCVEMIHIYSGMIWRTVNTVIWKKNQEIHYNWIEPWYYPLITFFSLDGWQLANWQKWKRVFLTFPCHRIYRDEAVGLKSCKYTLKITKFVKMGYLGQYRENLIFCQ